MTALLLTSLAKAHLPLRLSITASLFSFIFHLYLTLPLDGHDPFLTLLLTDPVVPVYLPTTAQ